MQTMLDASDTEATWLVLLTAGLPGGIGNTGGECGGLTAPLVQIGLRHGREETDVNKLNRVVNLGNDLARWFDVPANGPTGRNPGSGRPTSER